MKNRLLNILKWFVSVPPHLAAPGLRSIGAKLLWLLPVLLPYLLVHIWSGSTRDFYFMAWQNEPFSLPRLWNSAWEDISLFPAATRYFIPHLSLTLILGCCWWWRPRPLLYLAFFWAALCLCQDVLWGTWDSYWDVLNQYRQYKNAVPAWFLNFPLGHR